MDNSIVATFSLVARDEATGHLGVAVASKFLAVGSVVPTVVAGVGALASQARANTTYGNRAMEALRAGKSAEEIIKEFEATDDMFQQRQFGLVLPDGSSFSHTGSECLDWAGGIAGDGFAAQGNILAGPQVVEALVDTWKSSRAPFPERMLEALLAADEAGGDSRGRQSAAIYIEGEGMGYGGLTDRWIDLRVDDHEQPIPELQRLLGLYRLILGRSQGEPLALGHDEISWLQQRLGIEASGTWNDVTETKLQDLFSRENLEDRWLGGPLVDVAAWKHVSRVLTSES